MTCDPRTFDPVAIEALVRGHLAEIEAVCARGEYAWLVTDPDFREILAGSSFRYTGPLPAVVAAADDFAIASARRNLRSVEPDFWRKPSRLNGRAFVVVPEECGGIVTVTTRKNTLRVVS